MSWFLVKFCRTGLNNYSENEKKKQLLFHNFLFRNSFGGFFNKNILHPVPRFFRIQVKILDKPECFNTF